MFDESFCEVVLLRRLVLWGWGNGYEIVVKFGMVFYFVFNFVDYSIRIIVVGDDK